MSNAGDRFNNALRNRSDSHEQQRHLTPTYVLEAVRANLGGIELDPCTEPTNPTGARRFFTPPTDGASEPWDAGTIFVNPPYSRARDRWVSRCIAASDAGAKVALLMPAHTDTRIFQTAVERASHVVFIKGRVKFGTVRFNGRQEAASHPSCLVAWNLHEPGPIADLGATWDRTLTTDRGLVGAVPHSGQT